MRTLLGLAFLAFAPWVRAQDSRFQDELDLVVRSSVVQGSGARAFGMAGAFLARADDSTAASWNPAGLSYLRRPELSFVWIDGSVNSSETTARGAFLEDNRRKTQNPDFAAATFPFSLGAVNGAAQVSFQRVVSFDTQHKIAHINYDQNGLPTDEVRIDARSRGGYDVLTLATGWQLSHKLRLGLALNRWFNGYDQTLDKQKLVGVLLSRQESEFRISGWNVHAGLLFSPVPQLNLGVVVKTPFTMSGELTRNRNDYTLDRGGDLSSSTTASASGSDLRIQWPSALGLGLSWRPRNALTVSLDYTLTRWSRGSIENFFTLNSPNIPPTDSFFPVLPYPTLNDTRGQRDTQELRAGVEYVVIGRTVKWPLRAGAYANRQYFNQPASGPPRFSGIALGTGVIVGPILLDAAYVYESGNYQALDAGELIRVGVHSHRFLISTIYRQGTK